MGASLALPRVEAGKSEPATVPSAPSDTAAFATSEKEATFITFDAPGADEGTIPFDITASGAITGFIRGPGFTRHGFLRTPNGAFTIFDAPNAATGEFQGTRAYKRNEDGAITGWYIDASNNAHAYVRARNGSFTVIDAPGAGTEPYPQRTFSFGGITREGAVTGYYTDASNVSHGFLRAPHGIFITFDVLGAGTGEGQGTFAPVFGFGINTERTITGDYVDARNVVHGFVRAPDGTITTFDAPGAGNTAGSFQGTYPSSINEAGAICERMLTREMCITALCALPMARSQRSPLRARAEPATPTTGYRRLRQQPTGGDHGFTLTRIMRTTASCAIPTARSGRSTLRAQALTLARVPPPTATTHRGRSQDTILTPTM